jgi:hypothetical protein
MNEEMGSRDWSVLVYYFNVGKLNYWGMQCRTFFIDRNLRVLGWFTLHIFLTGTCDFETDLRCTFFWQELAILRLICAAGETRGQGTILTGSETREVPRQGIPDLQQITPRAHNRVCCIVILLLFAFYISLISDRHWVVTYLCNS